MVLHENLVNLLLLFVCIVLKEFLIKVIKNIFLVSIVFDSISFVKQRIEQATGINHLNWHNDIVAFSCELFDLKTQLKNSVIK